MVQKELTILNRLGLHARPAAQIVQTAAGFDCDIELTKDNVTINAKSIMGVMMLAAEFGAHICVTANGKDEAKALEALEKLFNEKFNEEF
jgi:phosphocarrier protein